MFLSVKEGGMVFPQNSNKYKNKDSQKPEGSKAILYYHRCIHNFFPSPRTERFYFVSVRNF
jgi:hypothetical protein